MAASSTLSWVLQASLSVGKGLRLNKALANCRLRQESLGLEVVELWKLPLDC